MSIARLALIVSAAALAACTAQMGYVPSATSPADKALIDRALMQNLADPQSAQVSNVAVFQAPNGARLRCGTFIAKNAYGGMTGYQPFVVGTNGGTDYSAPNSRPQFSLGPVAQAECAGAGHR